MRKERIFCDRCNRELFYLDWVGVQARRYKKDDYAQFYDICNPRCNRELFYLDWVGVQARRYKKDDYAQFYDICNPCWGLFMNCEDVKV